MARKKRRYRDTYEAIKSHQHITKLRSEAVHSWEVDDMYVNGMDHTLNRKRRSRIGHIETRKRK
jgi:hypothetical protein